MYTTCLYCSGSLGSNDTLELMPIGRRVAFDEAHGRLWAVCRWCGKWNLVPFDTRLETIDHCARLFRDSPTRFSTDNIGLARLHEGLDLIRIGPALKPEFAAWRYSYQLARRHPLFSVPLIGPVLHFVAGGQQPVTREPLLRDPWTDKLVRVPRAALHEVALVANEQLQWQLEVPYQPEVESWIGPERAAIPSIRDVPSIGLFQHERLFPTLGRLLPAIDVRRAPRHRLMAALQLLDKIRQPEGLFEYVAGKKLRYATQRRFILRDVGDEVRLALEMVAHEETERRALEGELRLLEREWKRAEEVAAIADALTVGE
jgi:hypothetical protein